MLAGQGGKWREGRLRDVWMEAPGGSRRPVGVGEGILQFCLGFLGGPGLTWNIGFLYFMSLLQDNGVANT